MGAAPPIEQEEKLKIEMHAIREALGPQDSQRLTEIRDRMCPEITDYTVIKDYNTAIDTACAKVSHALYEQRTNPVYAALGEHKKTIDDAADEIRARILDNSVFKVPCFFHFGNFWHDAINTLFFWISS